MPTSNRNKPPALIGNLRQTGWKDTARCIYREARQLHRLRLVVFVDDHQDVWTQKIRSTATVDQAHWLATYGSDLAINEIEDDLLHHLQSLTQGASA